MAIQEDGMSMSNGGAVRIVFPNAKVDMSLDNEAELENCIAVMRKLLEMWETNHAKKLLTQPAKKKSLGR